MTHDITEQSSCPFHVWTKPLQHTCRRLSTQPLTTYIPTYPPTYPNLIRHAGAIRWKFILKKGEPVSFCYLTSFHDTRLCFCLSWVTCLCSCVTLTFPFMHLQTAEPEELCVINMPGHMLEQITINCCPVHCHTEHRCIIICCWW